MSSDDEDVDEYDFTFEEPSPMWHARRLDRDGAEIVAFADLALSEASIDRMNPAELQRFLFTYLSEDECYLVSYEVALLLDCRFYVAQAAQLEARLGPDVVRLAKRFAQRLLAVRGIAPHTFLWIVAAIRDEAEPPWGDERRAVEYDSTFVELYRRIGERFGA